MNLRNICAASHFYKIDSRKYTINVNLKKAPKSCNTSFLDPMGAGLKLHGLLLFYGEGPKGSLNTFTGVARNKRSSQDGFQRK